jgi:transposase
MAKDSAVKARTQAINQLNAVLVTADPSLRESLAGLGRATLIRHSAQLPDPDPTTGDDVAATVVYTLRLLARRIQHLTSEINDLTMRISKVLADHAPHLLERRGVGPDSAATLLITAGDNPERLTTEASFAAWCGANPIQASSGKTRRHRLNRGGDRQANAALYHIALTRLRCDQPTGDYLDRRTAQGKTRREALRCVKRYIAREIYNLMRPPAPAAGTPTSTPLVA